MHASGPGGTGVGGGGGTGGVGAGEMLHDSLLSVLKVHTSPVTTASALNSVSTRQSYATFASSSPFQTAALEARTKANDALDGM
jgi:hypothetical protein